MGDSSRRHGESGGEHHPIAVQWTAEDRDIVQTQVLAMLR